MSGCSSRHGARHEAQTLSTHTLPFASPGENILSGCCRCGSLNSGAGLPMSGEGTSRGLSESPTPSITTSAMKMPRGMRYRVILQSKDEQLGIAPSGRGNPTWKDDPLAPGSVRHVPRFHYRPLGFRPGGCERPGPDVVRRSLTVILPRSTFIL